MDSNILLIVLDTVRKDHLSVYNSKKDTSPCLEEIAADGMVFDQAIAPAPWTLPVHASMFTGQLSSGHGATQESPYLDENIPTLAELLVTKGYATACFTSNVWITPYTGLTRGFQEHDNFFQALPEFGFNSLQKGWQKLVDNSLGEKLAALLVQLGNVVHERFTLSSNVSSRTPHVIDSTIEFIEGTDKPFFACVNLMDAHLPYSPPPRYRDQFAPNVDPKSVCQNSKRYNCGARRISDTEWEKIRGLYDGSIRFMDDELSRLFDRLRTTGHWEDTTIIICSDHGELHGEHSLYGHEFNLYEPVINVPLIIKNPTINPGNQTKQVELRNIFHTICDVGGIVEDTTAQRSFLRSSNGVADGPVFSEYRRPKIELTQFKIQSKKAGIEVDQNSRFYSRIWAARSEEAKYIHYDRTDDEFYWLHDDHLELSNAIGEETQTKSDLNLVLEAYISKFDSNGDNGVDTVLEEMDMRTKRRLKDLGYL